MMNYMKNLSRFRRKLSAKAKVIPDETVLNNIHNNVFKPRKHPGIIKPKSVMLPESFIKAVVNVTQDYPIKQLVEASEKLSRHLKGRVPPMENEELKERVQNIQQKVIAQSSNFVINNEEDEARYRQIVRNKTTNTLKEKVYNWQPLKYDDFNSLSYLFCRSAPEYAVLVRIFAEICSRDPEFKPRSLFDYGSGIGSATWAANVYWKSGIFEYYNVDISRDMNDLAQILLQGGTGTGKIPQGVFYRQFLPASNVTYDLVICAYTLLELPSSKNRLETILNLWNRTEKYLVIVEQGTNAGFKVINEIRDFILQINKKSSIGHVFSPCPHDNNCPRFLLDDGTPCNFIVNYHTLPVCGPIQSRTELYSYVVLQKGERSTENVWPRVVRPVLVRSKHSICRTCTAQGKLTEVIFTASKHGKTTYHCARSTKWGDLLPLTLEDIENEEEKTSQDTMNCESINNQTKTDLNVN